MVIITAINSHAQDYTIKRYATGKITRFSLSLNSDTLIYPVHAGDNLAMYDVSSNEQSEVTKIYLIKSKSLAISYSKSIKYVNTFTVSTAGNNDWLTVIRNNWNNIQSDVNIPQIFRLCPTGNDALCILWKYNNALGTGLIMSYGASRPIYFTNVNGAWQSLEL